MNKRDAKKLVKAAARVRGMYPLDLLEQLREQYGEAEANLQEKIDYIEEMENIGDVTQERLDGYHERMSALERAKEALDAMVDGFSDFESAVDDLNEYT